MKFLYFGRNERNRACKTFYIIFFETIKQLNCPNFVNTTIILVQEKEQIFYISSVRLRHVYKGLTTQIEQKFPN